MIPRSAALAALAALWLAAPAWGASWVPGDLHVHTCYSHDAYCGPTDDNTGPDTFYSSGGTVDERFLESSVKGLSFLAITDHDDIRAQSDPAFGTHGVQGIHAYEASLAGGHAQMLGATRAYPKGTGDAASTNSMADALRAAGGVFQANHPGYRAGGPFTDCKQAELANQKNDPLHWKYGYDVRPDTIEVWNATTLIQPSELFWECWLQRGARIGATAGSDSHGANTLNIGFPTTWAFARSSAQADVLAAVRAGRTTLSRVAPNQGAVRLLIEGDRDKNGSYESAIGDQVPVGTPLRVRAEGLPGRGLVRVRANGRSAVDGAELAPGGQVTFKAPADPGWAYAVLYLQQGSDAVDPSCGPGFPTGQAIDACSQDLAVAAITSPIWVGAVAAPEKPPPPGGTVPGTEPDSNEPDRKPPLSPTEQSGGAGRLPDVPPQRKRGRRVGRLKVTWFHAARRGGSRRVRLSWSRGTSPFQVQARAHASAWSTLRRRVRGRSLVLRLSHGAWSFRVRSHPSFAPAGRWRTTRARF
ncbi:MAG: hypothetical protein QOD53_2079 [Thermoleophilaceae bacterium]|nr:hypothetical protein [Thermoleophilaceae bacterium]